jgi:hypothetical protein
MDKQQGHAAGPCSMDMQQGLASRTCSMDMQASTTKTCGKNMAWSGHAALTRAFATDMQYSMNMQQGHATKTSSLGK